MKSRLFSDVYAENETNRKFSVQSSKMLRAHVDGSSGFSAVKGTMVAYQGNVGFSYRGSGIANKLKKMMSSEVEDDFMRVKGEGDVFLARAADDVFVIELEGESLTVANGCLLAFEDSLNYRISSVRSVGAYLADGAYNTEISGWGCVAISTWGQPVVLDASQQETFVDPQALVCWMTSLKPTVHTDFRVGDLFNRSSGETVQMKFHGPGFVVVQPAERA